MFPTVDEQLSLLMRGCEAVYTEKELRKRLEKSREAKRPLRIKLGMDPTAPDIHLGHSVVLRKMRQFQDCGHKAVLIIGDYTARIGDPTGKTKARPTLDEATIKQNAETYFQQAGHVLDTRPEKLEIRYNSEWLAKLTFADVLRLTSHMTVQQMLQRENFKLRILDETPIIVTEMMYPLMQAYDSVMIDADVELGGTDQTFNNLCGRDLMEKHGKPPQLVVIMPILRGLDGVEKMSKSLGNYVGLTDTPKDMFGKTMSIADSLMKEWYTLLTTLPDTEIETITDATKTHPREAKVRLAKQVVATYYDAAAADREEKLWEEVFRDGGLRDDIPTIQVPVAECEADGAIGLPKLMKLLDLAPSTSEARRLIQGGGVSVDRQKQTDPQAKITPTDGMLIQVGKRKAARIARP
ncbi:MAG: tyrosine--tRNA ligase [Planctomycetes bacterium UTPLA1]|nr:MAG: tyrosine--tRNA ligase [Planctomycetes bacterium UTPLA1]